MTFEGYTDVGLVKMGLRALQVESAACAKVPGSASIPRVRLQSTAQRSPAFNANPQADNHQLTYKYAALAIIRNALLSSPKSQSFC